MTTARRQLHLNAFLMTVGHHESAWRFPETDPLAAWDLKHYVHLARVAERGHFDSIFFGDGPALQGDIRFRPVGRLDPTALLPALAAVTERIGLVATASTTYNEPYNVARRFASIDHISGGRAGWNIVTSAGSDAAQNFGLDDVPEHRHRYERATEFVEVCRALWDSCEDDFLIGDKGSGHFADASKIHRVYHEGRFFRVKGPLNVPPSPPGSSLARAGGVLRRRARVRRAPRRGRVHRPADAGGRARFLHRPEAQGSELRARPGSRENQFTARRGSALTAS